MLDHALVEDILHASDIVDVISSYITITKKGRNYVAICPFHDDKNPSMMISKEKQIFKCFVCDTGGNAITFIQKFENLSFEKAVRKLADLINFSDSRLETSTLNNREDENEKLYAVLFDLTKFYKISLHANEGKEGLEYLTSRHIDEDVIQHFEIGYAPSNQLLSIKFLQASKHSLKDMETVGVAGHNSELQYVDKNAGRVIFPLWNSNGRVIGYSARRIKDDNDAKYINSPETPLFQKSKVLYNYHNAKKTARLDGYCYVLEGFMDVIALYRAGIKSAVALMGTALTNSQVMMLKQLNVEIRLCLDSDMPGQSATLKALEILEKEGIKYRIVHPFAEVKDSDEAMNKYGKDVVNQMINTLIDKIQFALLYYTKSNGLASIDERKKFVIDFLPFLASIKSELELSDYIARISKITNFDRNVILTTLKKYKKNLQSNLPTTPMLDFHPEKRVLKRLQLTERALIYQMLNSNEAIEFYQKRNVEISDEIYYKIANYIVNYYMEHHHVSINELITEISYSESSEENKALLIGEATKINLDRHYPKCNIDLLEDYLKIIKEERTKEYDSFILKNSLKNKTDETKLQILLEHNRKLNERLNKKEE